MEYPPRKPLNLRRTPEQVEREQQRRREEYERSRFNELPNVGAISDIPGGIGPL